VGARRIFRALLRGAGGFLLGTILLAGLYTSALMLWVPRDPAVDRAEPLRITRATATPGEATILFAGDTAEIDAALPTLKEEGLVYPFTLTIDLVRDADLAVANAEAPITDGGTRFPIYKDYIYRAPAASARALAFAGFDVLELANNHALDYGSSGLLDTIRNARAAGMVTVGGGADPVQARRGLIVNLGGVRVGLLDYCERQILWRVYVDQFVRPGHPGVAALTEGALARDIARLRPEVDVLVVSFHIGDNYAPPRASTIRWSERAIDLGADLVVDHHPHVAHPILLHHGKPILLSLGNYAFGTPGHYQLDYGFLALAHLSHQRLDRIEIVPLAVQNRRVHFRPEPLRGAELERALERLVRESAPLGAHVRIDSGRGILDL
jgi:poly-gamma-glutamate synthesis protein (capsule biosynthesis protein)